jgi:26S proteasome regulatory subunit N1
MDLLTKLSYDTDESVAQSSIFALGLIGAGTNNSRLANNLRFLASYYANKPDVLFVVRISQGLIHMGKGLLGLNPVYSDKFLFSNVSLAGLLAVLYAATDMKTFISGKHHYFLYFLVLSIYPRMCITVSNPLC